MKIIALIPIKNEAWVLRFTLNNLSLLADEILILDDDSEDNSRQIAESFPKVTVIPFTTKERFTNMSTRRNLLLREGRARGGTHFICLDADETFSSSFLTNFAEYIRKLKPGEVLTLPWILIQHQDNKLYYNKKDERNYKDFVFYDDGTVSYPNIALSEPRTPIHKNKTRPIIFNNGYVLHFQQLATTRNQLKQTWYRMNELIEGKRSAIRINATYAGTRLNNINNQTILHDEFTEKNLSFIDIDPPAQTQMNRIQNLITEHGIQYFEPLDIWHIPALYQQFTNKVGREPKPSIAPNWLLKLNNIKNYIKNKF